MKYVMLKIKQGSINRLVPIIFPDLLVHSEVAKYIGNMLLRTKTAQAVTPISAGDIDLNVSLVYGKSETLGLTACEDDSNVIRDYSYFHGICARAEEQ
jgi:hypothetical protein